MIQPNWLLLPCHSIKSGKCSCGYNCASPGKHPNTRRGVLDATNDWPTIEKWIARDPFLNLGVRTGEESGIWVLDIDYKSNDPRWDQRLSGIETLIAKTPRGYHYYWKWPNSRLVWLRNRTNVFDGVDVRGTNGYVILPLAHNQYNWVNDNPIIDAPQWLLDQVSGL